MTRGPGGAGTAVLLTVLAVLGVLGMALAVGLAVVPRGESAAEAPDRVVGARPTPDTMPPARDHTPPPKGRPPKGTPGEATRLAIDSFDVESPTRLRMRYTTGVPKCYGRLGTVRVVESGAEVVVTLRRRPPRSTGYACIEVALVKSVTVRLDRPLAGRAVVDGSSGRRVPPADGRR